MASAPTLTFDQLKAQILANARHFTVCEGYQELMKATDYQSLIDAGIPYLVVAYKSLPPIVTDALLAQVDQTLLNESNIYLNNATIVNPINEVFLFGYSSSNITLNDGARYNINVMGGAIAHIIISNNSWAHVRSFQDGYFTAQVNDTSALCSHSKQNSAGLVSLNNNASADVTGSGDTLLNVAANDTSFANVFAFGHTQVTTGGTGTINVKKYELGNVLIPVLP